MAKREIKSWLMDMDGVLVHEEQAIPGADRFISALREREIPFLVLTNNSIYTRRDLAARLRASGLDIPEEGIWTSALATAPVAGSEPSGDGPVASGLVAMKRAPDSIRRIARVIRSNEYVRVSPSTT